MATSGSSHMVKAWQKLAANMPNITKVAPLAVNMLINATVEMLTKLHWAWANNSTLLGCIASAAVSHDCVAACHAVATRVEPIPSNSGAAASSPVLFTASAVACAAACVHPDSADLIINPAAASHAAAAASHFSAVSCDDVFCACCLPTCADCLAPSTNFGVHCTTAVAPDFAFAAVICLAANAHLFAVFSHAFSDVGGLWSDRTIGAKYRQELRVQILGEKCSSVMKARLGGASCRLEMPVQIVDAKCWGNMLARICGEGRLLFRIDLMTATNAMHSHQRICMRGRIHISLSN